MLVKGATGQFNGQQNNLDNFLLIIDELIDAVG